MSDWSELSEEDHELNYILRLYDKKQTEGNQLLLKSAIEEFKKDNGGLQTKDYTKQEFYDFLEKYVGFLKVLEDA
jgi:hypothetical protein